ncbi:hypothetical protein DES53_108230 [Roseimicrobium gellanilyticum]|uniref:Knr4/Smi1-like domain-containing protein n=1 Tax=Roseimicrobium gellanilyticum TaxID=748857 RepID=A0A366HDJ5_9BACT|nr:SMI1/KNR4 family protein [Roseimicrobium gellanilyticum]RBP40523.1 hypothetical protein DES53_108230 [Roseimicrobium gellanilyticum]
MHREGRKSMRGCGLIALLWFAGALVLTMSGDKVNAKEGPWVIIIPAIMIYLSLGGPFIAMIYGYKVIHYLNWRRDKGMGSLVWRLFVSFWMLIGGMGILILAADNAYHAASKMVETQGAKQMVAGVIILLTCVGVRFLGLGIMRVALSTKAVTSEDKDLAAAESLERAWEQLDFASLEQQLGCTLPVAYKAMMQPGSEWREKSWTLRPHRVAWFHVIDLVPPDRSALRKSPATGEVMLCFANADSGEYWLRPGGEDPPVYTHYTDHSGEVVEEIAPQLSVFLGWKKAEYE